MSANPLRQQAERIFRAAVTGASPARLLASRQPRDLLPHPHHDYERIVFVGAGKASLPLAAAAARILPPTEGRIVVPRGYRATAPVLPPAAVEIVEGGHPLPDRAGLVAARRALDRAGELGPGDLLVALISGGGSALWTLPPPPLTLADLQATTTALLASGLPIDRVNTVRRHLSAIAGGRLAAAAHPAAVAALVISDVPGDDPAVVAGGPTVADPTTYADALVALAAGGILQAVPPAVRDHLEAGRRGEVPDTPATLEGSVRTTLVGASRDALAAAAEAARDLGWPTRVVAEPVEGEARAVGARLAEELLAAAGSGPLCLLWGGETTVTLTGPGRGGRNQETALGAAAVLDGCSRRVALLSGGTDGVDGPTPAAGALVDRGTAGRARAAGLDLEAALAANDAWTLLEALDELVITGPTHTNVMDVMVGLCAGP